MDSLEGRGELSAHTAIDEMADIVDRFYEKRKKEKRKAQAQAPKKKSPEPYQQKSLSELRALAMAEFEKTGERDGPAYQEYTDALENQDAIKSIGQVIADEAVDKTWIPETDKTEGEEGCRS